VIGRYLVPTSHWPQGNAQELTFTDGFRYFTKSQVAYWKKVISKEQAKTLSMIFSSTEKPKIVKTISECTENVPIYYHKP
jgi:hypothetical protein